MQKTETLDSFYQDKFNQSVSELGTDQLNFNLFRFEDCATNATKGYFFIFKEVYLTDFFRSGVRSLPLFTLVHKPAERDLCS